MITGLANCAPDGVIEIGGCWSIVDEGGTADALGRLTVSSLAGTGIYKPDAPNTARWLMFVPVDVDSRISVAVSGVGRQVAGPAFRPSADGRSIVIPWSRDEVRIATTLFGVADAGYLVFWR